jgi:iron complex outermembrane receptor protein
MTNHDSDPKGPAIKRYAMTPLAAAVVTAMNPGSAALAQDDDNNLGIEEIVVTATKRSMDIQDVAQSITAFSTAEIERRGMLDMSDIAANLPSITLSSSRAGRNELVYRGISNGGSWRLDSQVAMYLDEMPMTMSTTQLDPRMVDIQRVESLPGPQGTLFGSSSQSGTIRVVTNKPRFDGFSAEVSAEVKSTSGGEESYDINGYVNIPVSDNFAIRLVAYDLKEGGYIDNVYSTAPHSVCAAGAPCDLDFSQYVYGPFNPVDQQGYLNSATPDNAGLEEDNFNDYEMSGARISALWNINENWSVLGTLMHQDSLTTGVWSSDTALGDYKVARFTDEWRKDKWTTYALTVTGDLGFAQISNSTGYAERSQSYQFDNTHYEAYHTRLKGQYWSAWKNWYDAYWYYTYNTYNYYDKYDTDYNGGIYRSLQDAERITNELRLTSTTDSRFQWMIGAFYENNKDGWDDNGDIPNLNTTKHWRYTQWRSCDLAGQGFDVACPAVDPNNTWYNDNYARDITQISAFGEFNYSLTDDLVATVGFRWFEYDRHVVNDQQWPPGLPVEAILLDGEGAFVEEGKEDDTSYKVALSYTLDDDKMIYGLYSQGFRLGGNNNAKAVRVNFVPATYNPDQLNNYEIGLKSEWLDNRLQINATVFHMVWDDIQLVLGSSGEGLWWLSGQDNGGGGENTGLELDVLWQATRNLRLSANVYVGDPEYTHDYITLEGELEMSAGTQMPDSAKEKYTIAVDYTFRDVIGGDVWVRFDTYYQGPMFSALWRADDANPNSPDYEPGNKEDVDSFSKSNIQIGYERETWNTRLMVRNVFDDRANTFTGSGTGYYGDFWGHTGFGNSNNLARPRTISLKFTKHFD